MPEHIGSDKMLDTRHLACSFCDISRDFFTARRTIIATFYIAGQLAPRGFQSAVKREDEGVADR